MIILSSKQYIIVSCTSWKKRIKYTPRLIENMVSQTLLPDKIILNLSFDEFKNKENDLPNELIELTQKYKNIFTINWIKENTIAYKKLLPTAKLYSKFKDCFILTVDEDYEYNNDYIEFMVNTANKYPNNYITPGTYNDFLHGYAAIYNTNWFNKLDVLWKISRKECLKIPCSDHWIMKCLNHINITNKVIPEIQNKIKPIELPDRLSKKYEKLVFTNKLNTIINNTFDKVNKP